MQGAKMAQDNSVKDLDYHQKFLVAMKVIRGEESYRT